MMTDVLIIEDNPADQALALHILKKNSNITSILTASDGVEALDLLFLNQESTFLPRIILLDLKLPKLNGIEVLKKIKDDKRTKCIPVIVLSSSDRMNDIQECYLLGANSYIVKPINFDQYSDALNAVGRYWVSLNETFI